MKNTYDVCVIGAGIIGAAVARELSRFNLKTVVVEKQSDVSEGTTKANSAIVHSGYDAEPGSAKAKYNVAGSRVFEDWCRELTVPYRRNGSLVLAFSEDGLPELEKLIERGRANGVEGLSILNQSDLRAREPRVGTDAVYALLAETGAICSPYDLTIRLIEHAIVNGVELKLNFEVNSISKTDDRFLVSSAQEVIECRVVINAAGVYADRINDMISQDHFCITPRRGEYWMIDKALSPVFNSTIFQLPTAMGKGVLVTPTVENTIILGPTAEDIDDKEDVRTTAVKLEQILEIASRSWPDIPRNRFITAFAGLRAHCDRGDFIVGKSSDVSGYYLAAGIESPGLTAAPAIAAELTCQVVEELGVSVTDSFLPPPPAIESFRESGNQRRRELIAADPAYGRIICRCEQVSEAEIRQAINRPNGAKTVDAIKRRTRAGMGRCQSGFCLPLVLKILAEELRLDPADITKAGEGSEIISGHLGGDYHD
ncbi:MAG: glycerol-3-phosphate dehydrogenase [Clostridiales bacterium]|jgi:glycerol-3-phosphate dehydrogenase|nr:glycerol-3-phosphate dehydrogenase [Clostridiales bacterium]